MSERELPHLLAHSIPSPVDAAFLREHSEFLTRLARELVRDPHTADDLVQDTLVTALEHPPQGEITRGGWRAWLATVLRHRAERKSRESDARRRREHEVARLEATDPAHGHSEERERLRARLAEAVLALDEPYRSVVILRWREGKSPREIAELQGITYEAARQRLSRATAMLRAQLERDFGMRSNWGFALAAVPSPSSAENERQPPFTGPLIGHKHILIGASACLLLCFGALIDSPDDAIGAPEISSTLDARVQLDSADIPPITTQEISTSVDARQSLLAVVASLVAAARRCERIELTCAS